MTSRTAHSEKRHVPLHQRRDHRQAAAEHRDGVRLDPEGRQTRGVDHHGDDPPLLGRRDTRDQEQDRADEVDAVHVEAAVALWRYCWSTARSVYGFSLADPVADELWKVMSVRPEGMARTEIRDWFSRNKKRSEIDRALQLVQDAGLLRRLKETPSGGGPTIERYVPGTGSH